MLRIVIAGVSGCGKTTVGRALAKRIDAEFLDADDFHPPENVAKMASGIRLTDEDRWPWLDRLGKELAARDRVVLACSALKRIYRERLAVAVPDVIFVVLDVPRDVLELRMNARQHFMPSSLLDSQLADLEIGEEVRVVENTGEVEAVVDRIYAAFTDGRGQVE